jgi:hypothetical protein
MGDGGREVVGLPQGVVTSLASELVTTWASWSEPDQAHLDRPTSAE